MAIKPRNAAHTAGIFADMSLDGPEIGTLVAVVDRARNLPNRKTMGKQDPYCAMRLGKEAKKTDTDKRGGQTPKWDQELRFTVHDSPDYYKLKCSLFNDDKKTDLIGEAWIDLRDVIKPGGGQNDIWHQLNFKGKYAGEIRVELTYYDSRPKPEPPAEKKTAREAAYSTESQASYDTPASGSRKLGPREIKRRPLPPDPTGNSSAADVVPHEFDDRSGLNYPRHPGYNDTNPPPRPPKEKWVPETPDDFGYDPLAWRPEEPHSQFRSASQSQQFHPDDYAVNEPEQPPQLRDEQRYSQPVQDGYDLEDPYYDRHHHPMDHDQYTTETQQNTHRDSQGSWNEAEHASHTYSSSVYSPHSPHNEPPQLPMLPSPPARSQSNQPQPWNGRGSTSPTKYAVYKDSPLRQSVTRHDIPTSGHTLPDPRFDEEDDAPPPPPPVHRGPISRMPDSVDFQQGCVPTTAPRTPTKFASVDERSPLQRLEYEPQQHPSPNQPLYSQSPAESSDGYHGQLTMYSPDTFERRRSYNESAGAQLIRQSPSKDSPRQQYGPESHAGDQTYDPRFQDHLRRSGGYDLPRRAQTFDAFDAHDERHVRRSDPMIVRPRAVSPNVAHTIPRKSVSPQPTTPQDVKPVDAPFGPDYYDILNPGTSPAERSPFDTPEKAKDAARQREIDRLRDPGPIIGNDGRIIDPSDHLPADTWAPEPERKNRKPEHVIKIRTREEARAQSRGGSSPASARPHSIAGSPFQQSPAATAPHQGSPSNIAVSPTAEPTGRNRLQKRNMPTRPLPQQPYPHAQTSPAVMTTSPSQAPERPSPNIRHSVHGSPAGNPTQRPPISEYQVMAANPYAPPKSGHREEYSTPTKQPSYDLPAVGPAYSYGPGDDSLALELSMIDIGPSRAPRTTLRASRGYGY